MIKKNITFVLFLASMFSVSVLAHRTERISKNEREVFCNFYARLEGFKTNFELGAKPESLRFCYKKVQAHVSEKIRRNLQRKWNYVACKKDLSSMKKELYRACLKNSSSLAGRKKCQQLVDIHLNNLKEALFSTLAEAEKKGISLCNKIKMVPRRRRR